jgi:hypothetical protein
MNIKYETKYKEMLESCNEINLQGSWKKKQGVDNAFRLIECHLREQFTYDYDILTVPLKRDDSVIDSLIKELEKFHQKAKDDAAFWQRQVENEREEMLNAQGFHSPREMFECAKSLREAQNLEKVGFKIRFLKELVLSLPHGSRFPLIITGNIMKMDDSVIKTYGGTATGTISSTGQFNGTYTPVTAYSAKGKILHAFLFFKDSLSDCFPISHFVKEMPQLYSKRTFNTDLDYDLDAGTFYTIVECTPHETDPMYQSVIQGLIDPNLLGLWQAHARKNYKSVQGQQSKKTGLLNALFSQSRPEYSPFNLKVKQFIKKELEIRAKETEQEKLLEKQYNEKMADKAKK